MIKRDESKVYNFEKGSLSSFSDYGLLIPFANMDSAMRQHMWHSHIKQTIIPANNPERPIVDTRYTKDILFSSDNTLSTGKITLIDRIDKIINNYRCNTTFIYYDHDDDLYYVEKLARYKSYSSYCYEEKSELENMEIGETRDRIYTRHISAMDIRDGGIAFGKNVEAIFAVDVRVGEDALVITKELAESFAVNMMYTPQITFNPKDEVLIDRYGFLDSNGIRHYRPFPLPGEEVKEGVVAILSKMAKDFLSLNDNDIHSSDIAYYIHSGIVTDVEVYSNNKIESNILLEELRRLHLDYYHNIAAALMRLPSDKLSIQAKSYLDKMTSITVNKLRFGLEELKDNIKIKLTIVGKIPLGVGSKLTNRHGGKGTVTKIVDKIVSEDGRNIDIIVNGTGVINRENIAQQMEQGLNVCNNSLMKYLRTSNDSIEVKYKNLLKWMSLARLDDFAIIPTFQKYSKEEIVKHFSEKEMYMKYDPFDNNINYDMFLELLEFTLKLDPEIGPKTIYEDGIPLGDKHTYGKIFMVVLENGFIKDTSIRSDRINTAKGSLTKVGLDKKKYHSKYLTTAVKQSDLSLNIFISSQFDEDRDLLSSDLSQLVRRFDAMGIDIGLEKIPEGE